jgi:signal transduction histidine kinase/DNA-binding NarL/FixJ family response regulator
MEDALQSPYTLRFASRPHEAAFREVYAHESLRQVRGALLLGVALYGPLFGAVDVVDAPDVLYTIWAIRLGVCLVALAVYAFTYSLLFERYMQPALSLLLLLGGLGLVTMLTLEETGPQYFDGPALVILAAYVAVRLRFVWATAVGWATTAAYAAVVLAFREEGSDFLASSIWFIAAANVIGMFAAYGLESFARRDFLQVRALEAKRQELEGARAQAAEQAARLSELDEAKSRFFANVSHELRTPLTLLLGPLRDALGGRYDGLTEEWGRLLPIMHRSGERLLGLVDRLLDLARLDAGRLRLRVVEVDLVALTRRAVLAFASRAEREGLALTFEAEQERLDVWVDAERYEQVLSNLLTNALKFTPTGGQVCVALREDDGAAVLTVRDTGEGIPAEVLPRIFDRFRQGDETATRRHEGAGIGLALVRELVVLHGGTVEADSTVGLGSTFHVRLPLGNEHFEGDVFDMGTAEPAFSLRASWGTEDPVPEPSNLVAAPDPSAPFAPDATVLVVEDHADMRTYLRSLLAPYYHVEEAEDGCEGVEKARRLAAEGRTPDLVLSDIMMPGMDGYALCHTLKEDDALGHVPVVLLTARVDEESKLEGLGEGADDYLAKPFSAEELLARCENLIEVRRRLRARFSGEVVVKPTDVTVPVEEANWLEEVRAMCEPHLSDAGFGVDWLADELEVSTRTLQRRMKSASGLTPGAFLRTLRLERAAQLLERGSSGIGEVAVAVGYTDPDSFGRAFRQGFGISPSAYGESVRAAQGGEKAGGPG